MKKIILLPTLLLTFSLTGCIISPDYLGDSNQSGSTSSNGTSFESSTPNNSNTNTSSGGTSFGAAQ